MYKIVIVDDDTGLSASLSSFFPWQEHGFEVVGQFSGASQALTFLSENPVDVLICDICMPGMSGLELVRELQLRGSKVQVILLSAYKDFQYAKEAMLYGIKYYLVKPATYSDIIAVLREVKNDLKLRDASEAKAVKEPISSFNAKIISQVKVYIDQHYDTVTLQDLADLTHMNLSYLSRFFKDNAGENISAYLMRVKMENALLLLRDVDFKNISDVAEKLGYSNAKSFTKAFKSYYSITPQEYRKNFRSVE